MKPLLDMKYSFADIVDIGEIRGLLESFSEATGFTTGLVENRTNEVLVATGWREICVKYHRANPDSVMYCKSSNTKLTTNLEKPGQIHLNYCENGLIDGATPIIIEGSHLANLFTGQILFEQPDTDRFLEQAKKFGYDTDAYLDALKKVPVVSEMKFRAMLVLLANIATIIANMGLSRLESRIKLKEISGLLPICSNCKKIRDDKGYWEQIETYIRNHSKAEFSHGLCPECAKRIYPEYFKDT